MTSEFTPLNLHPQLVQAVEERGYQTPTPIQAELIPVMITGQDVIGQAQTGTGKTAAFALPILQRLSTDRSNVQSLVLAPTRELALQVSKDIEAYGRFSNVKVLAVYGGAAYGPQISQLKRGVDVVVGTPGRLMDLMRRKVLDLSHVQTVVLDEADEMLSMGFIEDIESILSETPDTRQTALFSATLPTAIRKLADNYMRNPHSIMVERKEMTVEAIEQRCYVVHKDDRLAALTRLFEIEEITSALIFVRTRIGTGELANELTRRGYPSEALSGELSQDARERTLKRFRDNLVTVLVATDVAARGLDIDDISHVFNFDLPDDPEIYVHRIGRTGRAGKTGVAISLLSYGETRRLGRIESFTRHKIARTELPTEDDITAYREKKLVDRMMVWQQRGRYKREREIIEKLIEEGHDPIELAAAALKTARAEEKQRPIAPLTPRSSRSQQRSQRKNDGKERSSQRRGSRTLSHEPGMMRLNLDKGKKDGIRPNDIVGAIAFHANIPGHSIGRIHIQDKNTLVDVPEQLAPKVLAKSGTLQIRRLRISLQPA
jgi:ATP-dependent RNA helicase DeaD